MSAHGTDGRLVAGAAPGVRGEFDPLAALEAMDAGVLVLDAGWTIRYVNGAFERIVGLPAGRCVGRTLWERFPALAGWPEAQVLRHVMRDRGRESARLDLRRTPAGAVFDVTVSSCGAGLCVQLRDISTVVQLEHQYDRVLGSIGEALLVVDAGWRVVYWNDEAERVTGWPRRSVVGARLWEQFEGLAETPFGAQCRATMETREAREIRSWRNDGAAGLAPGVYDARMFPVDDGGVLLVFNEVSERIQRERQLVERSEESEGLRHLARQMAAEWDSDALLRILCEEATRQCRATESMVARHEGETGVVVAAVGGISALSGVRFPLDGSLIERVVRERSTVAVAQYASRSPYFQQVTQDLDIGPMVLTPLIAHGELLGVLGVSRKRSAAPFSREDEQRLRGIADHAALALWKSQLLEASQAANRAKSNFLATMSHELRTPLAALTGYGELLADEIVGQLSPEQADVVERMRSVTHHLSAMIDEVLTFSSLEAGCESVRPSAFEAADVVRAAVAVVAPLAAQKELALHLELPDEPLPLDSDVDKVRQILVNLVGNAVKFTERGHVHVAVRSVEGEVRFSVRDTGIGIAKGDLDRLFRPFSQLDSGLTRRHGGTGLGLYISHRLARLLGGRMEVESSLGQGSTFSLVVPGRAGRIAG